MSTIRGMKDRHQAPSYPLRLPEELKKRVEEAAALQGRSLNSEIAARLQQSFFESLGVEELRRELEYTKEALQRRDHSVEVALGGQDMLAGYIVALFKLLPQKLQENQNLRIPLRLAESILKRDGPAIADAFADMFADDSSLVEDMRRVRAEIEAVKAPKRPLAPALLEDHPPPARAKPKRSR